MMEALLLGASLGLFVGMSLSDVLGRKNTVLISMLLSCIGVAMIMIFANIELKCIGLVLWGGGA